MSLVRRFERGCRACGRDPCDCPPRRDSCNGSSYNGAYHSNSKSSCSSCDHDTRGPPPKKNHLLDVIGSHRELTVIGHVNVIKFLPFVRQHNLILLEQYYRQPGNYAGRPGACADTTAKVIDYGNDYLALKLYDDLTRPEVGEFLLNRGWDMIGYATSKHQDSIFVMEKWCSKDEECGKCGDH